MLLFFFVPGSWDNSTVKKNVKGVSLFIHNNPLSTTSEICKRGDFWKGPKHGGWLSWESTRWSDGWNFQLTLATSGRWKLCSITNGQSTMSSNETSIKPANDGFQRPSGLGNIWRCWGLVCPESAWKRGAPSAYLALWFLNGIVYNKPVLVSKVLFWILWTTLANYWMEEGTWGG